MEWKQNREASTDRSAPTIKPLTQIVTTVQSCWAKLAFLVFLCSLTNKTLSSTVYNKVTEGSECRQHSLPAAQPDLKILSVSGLWQ